MERAFQLDSRFAVLANNLAWLLAHSSSPDLDRALKIAETVVAKNPANARFRDTLGTILMKQKKFDQAVAEFKKALLNIPDKKSVHLKLAAIYHELGKKNLAASHENRAKDLSLIHI